MFYPKYAAQLENLILKHDLQVVISSSWRESAPLERIKTYFRKDVQSRIIGMTPVLPQNKMPPYIRDIRQREILQWMSDQSYSGPWIAIDDDKRIFEPNCKNLIECDFSIGLDESKQSELEEMILMFKNCCTI